MAKKVPLGKHAEMRRLRFIVMAPLIWAIIGVILCDFIFKISEHRVLWLYGFNHTSALVMGFFACVYLVLQIGKVQKIPWLFIVAIVLMVTSQMLRVARNFPSLDNTIISNNLSHALDDASGGLSLVLIGISFLSAIVDLLASRHRLAQYEDLLNNLPVPVYRNTPGPDGRFQEMNPAHVAMFEADSPDPLMRRDVSSLYRDPATRVALSEKCMRQGYVRDEEVELVTLKGRSIWGSVTAILRETDDGTPCFDGVILDITDKKLAQEEYKTILDTTMDGFTIADSDGRFLDVNNAYCALVGFTRQELLTMHIKDMVIGKSPEETAAHIARAKDIGHERFETCHRSKDGGMVELEVSANYREVGVGRLYAFVRDIRERKQAEAALRASEAKYRELVHSANSIILRMDTAGRITFFNEFAQQFFGYSEEEILGRNIADTIVPAENSNGSVSHPALLNLLHPASHADNEHENVRRNGERVWIAWTGKPIYGDAGGLKEVLCVGNDITDRVLARRVIAEQQIKMIAASRLSAVGTMASGIAHEINNPLAIISAAAEQLPQRLHESASSDEELERFLGVITRHTSRISNIVRGLRLLARDGSADPFRSAKVNSLITDTLELCQARFVSHNIDLHVTKAPDALCVDCRASQVAQVLLNLLNNAHDAIEKLPEKWVRLDVEDDHDSILMSVTDSGKGLPDEVTEKVGVPFFTTKEVGRGIGLGLSISTRIAESHGGELYVDRESANTRFVFRLPKHPPA